MLHKTKLPSNGYSLKYTISINLGANDYIEIDQAAEPPISNRFEVHFIYIHIIHIFIYLYIYKYSNTGR